MTRTNLSFIHFLAFYSVFKLGVTASAIGMVFIQYERCSHVKILSFVIIIHKFCIIIIHKFSLSDETQIVIVYLKFSAQQKSVKQFLDKVWIQEFQRRYQTHNSVTVDDKIIASNKIR